MKYTKEMAEDCLWKDYTEGNVVSESDYMEKFGWTRGEVIKLLVKNDLFIKWFTPAGRPKGCDPTHGKLIDRDSS